MGCSMKTITSPVYSPEKCLNIKLTDGLTMEINIKSNFFDIPVYSLFSMAVRKNPKRPFLFVSKILGKHLPVDPALSLVYGAVLAAMFTQRAFNTKAVYLPEAIKAIKGESKPVQVLKLIQSNPIEFKNGALFIGFAETATGLGHSMYNCFEGPNSYIHTTRDDIPQIKSKICFEEEHSHATTHRIYPLKGHIFENKKPIVLIDDEITTGNTVLNIIKEIQKLHPRKEYYVMSLLDWRSKEWLDKFSETEQQLGIRIHTMALIEGNFSLRDNGFKLNQSKDENIIKHMGADVNEIQLSQTKPHIYCVSSVNTQGEENTVPFYSLSGRFGINNDDNNILDHQVDMFSEILKGIRKGKKTLCVGTGEFIYLPMRIAANLGEGVLFQSSTRSPIYHNNKNDYIIKSCLEFPNPGDRAIKNYLYNIPYGHYDDLFLFFERKPHTTELQPLMDALQRLGIPKIYLVYFTSKESMVNTPQQMGSYSTKDVVFLLKNINGLVQEKDTGTREEIIQSGGHYSEMLPVEYEPSQEYIDIFNKTLNDTAKEISANVGIVAEKILKNRGSKVVLVSLARAGTPVGILIKRYILFKYNLDVPHYSISIIRGKGIDENAICYLLQRYPDHHLQFIDGWTGKGAITKVLSDACREFQEKYGVNLDNDLAVLADPGHSVSTFGSREDILIPSACLNSTVSGLVSRTVHRQDIICQHDFHGAKYYEELIDYDMSNLFVDTISEHFGDIQNLVHERIKSSDHLNNQPTWRGLFDIRRIQEEFKIDDINLIKPGVGETTRVLLRRVPWIILIKSENDPGLKHVLLLAKEKNVPVRIYPEMTYSCCGIIKPVQFSQKAVTGRGGDI